MKILKNNKELYQSIYELRDFLMLWSTQSISQLGSSITAFALTLWLYEKTGSSLSTAALTICSYVPYVLMSIFAGALTDRFNKKKTMLVCDVFAAVCTVVIFVLFRLNRLIVWHLYVLNAVSGLMNTVQQPASEVAMTIIIPEKYYQKTSGLCSLSRSLLSILNPLIATALYALAGLNLVIAVDLGSFAIAFVTLLFFIRIPETKGAESGSVLKLAKGGIQFLRENPMIMTLIFFMSGVNLVASAFDATLPGYVLRRHCHDFRQSAGLCSAKTKGQSAGNLFDDAVFARHRKFPAGIFQRASFMVYRSADWLDTCAGYECESGCDSQNKYSGRFAGACVRLPQHISTFLRFQSDCLPAALW